MASYVVAHVDITNAERYGDYVAGVLEQIAQVGGRVLAAGPAQPLEGEPMVNNNVVIEFPDDAAALGWFQSQAYREIVPIRLEASASSQVGLVQGWPLPSATVVQDEAVALGTRTSPFAS
jgi:uncharacterized protein (DUF1330 family)